MPDKASSCGGALYAECSSRSESGGHGQRRGRVAAQCRLSAPNADGKQKRHCAIKLNANGRLDNLLSAICRSSPHEAGGGTKKEKVKKYELMQGDCLELLKDIPDCSVDMVLTDPPYGVIEKKHSRFERGWTDKKNHLGHTAQRRFNFGCMQ